MNWKPVVGYEGLYEVSDTGLVKSLARLKQCGHKNSKPQTTKEKFLTIRTDRNGYKRAKLSKNGKAKLVLLHRIIAQAFIPNPKGLAEVNHIDGDKNNNVPNNLEWTTRSKNMKHAFENNLKIARKGEENNKSKLTTEDVKLIRTLRKQGYTLTTLAERFQVTPAAISAIANFKTWKEVE